MIAMDLLRIIMSRLLRVLTTLVGVSLLTFVLVRLAPGDPVALMIGPRDIAVGARALSEVQLQALRAELGLDQPLPVQYLRWLGRVLSLDLGTSFRSRQPVSLELARRVPATALLAGGAFLAQAGVAISLGTLAAVWMRRWPDHLTRLLAVVLSATPGFLLALLMLILFGVKLQWFAISGPARLDRLLLPAITLGLLSAPPLMRVVRANLIHELSRPYIVAARARGLTPTRVVIGHALRNGMLPVLTLLGLNLAGLLSGAVIIETVFTWPGIGKYAVESILARDYPVIQGYVLLVTTLVITINALVDLGARLCDPRLRAGGSTQ